MTTLKRLLAVPVLLTLSAGLARASDIIDGAGLFSPAAIRQAEATLDRAQKSTGHEVVIETVETLNGRPVDAVALANAKGHPSAALYVLIAKKETKFRLKEHTARLSASQASEVDAAFIDSLKTRDFDGALTQGSDRIATVLAAIPAATRGRTAPANRQNRPPVAKGGGSIWPFLLTIGAILLVVMLVMRVIGSIAGRGAGYGPGGMRPGMGGGGYGAGYGGGGGGGGFFSSMLGGIGGAVAGNWMYDQFRNRDHGSGYDAGNAGSGNEAANDPGWVDGGGGDWGGGGGDAGGGGGGGDWGGGGDVGGGGGGDWGGGGGGGGDWS